MSIGLSGFRVLEVLETNAEMIIDIETLADVAGCVQCGVRAEAQDRCQWPSRSATPPASDVRLGCGGTEKPR